MKMLRISFECDECECGGKGLEKDYPAEDLKMLKASLSSMPKKCPVCGKRGGVNPIDYEVVEYNEVESPPKMPKSQHKLTEVIKK